MTFGTVFVWNEGAVRELLEGRSGPVARDLDRRCALIETQAKKNASVGDGVGGTPRTFAPGLRTVSGIGKASIQRTGPQLDGKGLYEDVGTNSPHMAIQEQKTTDRPNGPYLWLRPAMDAGRD